MLLGIGPWPPLFYVYPTGCLDALHRITDGLTLPTNSIFLLDVGNALSSPVSSKLNDVRSHTPLQVGQNAVRADMSALFIFHKGTRG